MITHLSSTVNIKKVSEEFNKGIFEIDGLYVGYGLTIGNALRRTLLSSIPGAAVTYIKIKNVHHEFSTLPGVKEDVLELSLNFKKLRFNMYTDDPQTLFLRAKGEKEVLASDIEGNSFVEVVNKNEKIATLTDKNALLEVELTVERGLGYLPVEARKKEKLPIGVIALDAFFSPVTKVSYNVENMMVSGRADYNRLNIEIETDGTISPSSALRKVSSILKDHFEKIMSIDVNDFSHIEGKNKSVEIKSAEMKEENKSKILKEKTKQTKKSKK